MPKERKSRPGLEVISRPGTRALYLRGTIRGQRIFESTGTDDPALAEEARATREAELYRAAIHGTKPTMTFAAAALAYLQQEERSAATKRDIGRLVAHLGPRIACDKVDQDVIDGAAKALCQADSKLVTKYRHVTVPATAVLNFAARRGRCEVPKFERAKDGGKRTEWVTPAEAEAMIAGVSKRAKHLKPMLAFLFCTGARMGEVIDLEWQNVDLQHARVVFVGERDDGGRGTKSGNDRIVDLPPRAVAALANLSGREGRVFRRHDGEPFRRTSESKDGKWFGGGQVKHSFATAVEKAGIKRHISPHICRHTWATWHYGVHKDLLKLRDDGGWATTAMVERYTKLCPASMVPEILAFWGLPATEVVQPSPAAQNVA